jgi:hypothetical protein
VNGAGPRTLDWNSILGGLAELRRSNPQLLEENVLVGGAACLFYRDQLERINDPDFRVRTYSTEEEEVWLSRDADFATTEPEKMPDHVGPIPLGRLQMGFVIGAVEFKENARDVSIETGTVKFSLLIADPLDLWREKEAAIYRRSRPQDALHLEVLGSTLQWEIAHYANAVANGSLLFRRWEARVREISSRWRGVFDYPPLRGRVLSLGIPEMADFIRNVP